MADESIIANLKSEGIKELITDLSGASKGFSLLDKSIAEAQKKLTTLDQSSQEFKDLTKEINAASTAMEAFNQDTGTLKKELRDTTNEIGNLERSLKELEKTGQKNTQVYKDLSAKQDELKKKAGQLKDTVSDLNAEIKNSGSDTKNLDKALRAINTVAAGYQVAQGALVLFGGENKKFEQTLLKLNAVMAITQGLQQIQNELSKKDSLYTIAATKAKAAYTLVVGESVGALKLFKIALASTGIGLLVIAVGYLISNFDKLKTSSGLLGVSIRFIGDVIESVTLSIERFTDFLGLTNMAEQKLADEQKKRRDEELEDIQRSQKLKLDLLKIRHKDTLKEELKFAKESRERAREDLKLLLNDNSKDGKILQKEKIKQINDLNSEITKLNAEIDQKKIDDQKKTDEELKKESEKAEQKRLAELKKRLDEEARILKEHLKHIQDLRLKSVELQKKIELKQKEEADKRRLFEDNRELDNIREQQARINNLRIESDKQNLEDRERNAQKERDKFERDRLNDERKALEEQQAQRFELAQASAVALFAIAQGISDFRKQTLDNELASGLISEKKYQEELKKIKRQEAIANKAQAVFNIGISIAEAIVKALAAGPVVGQVLAGITAALGFAQLAFVLATPLPKFKKGGQVSEKLGLIKGKSHSQGGVPIEVEGEEYVMPVEETRKNIKALKAIHEGKFDKLFVPRENLIQPDIFANIPNPANIDSSILVDKEDYSSINSRLDKVASELYWLGQQTKLGNKDRRRANELLSSKFNYRKSNPNL